MAKIQYLKDNSDVTVYPITHERAVKDSNGVLLETKIAGKQDSLISGTNIKTINNESLLGSGNLSVVTDISGKQDTLVSGTNIKTVNGESLLGSGNIVAGDPNAIKYTEQSLTSEQQTQARTNIGSGTYSKPSGGIPMGDLASGVQTSLGKADTAVQAVEYGTTLQSAPIAQFCHVRLTIADLPGGDLEDFVATYPDFYLARQRYDFTDDETLYSGIFTYQTEETNLEDPMGDTLSVPHTLVIYAIWSAGWYLNHFEINNPVNPDWNATSGLAEILNKPIIPDISGKQDVIQDLQTIRTGAAAGATAYQKPGTGIPASDLASGVIPTVPTISTDVSADAASDVKTSSPKSVKTYVDAGIAAVESDLADLADEVEAIDIGAYVVAWDGNSEPVVANIPAGVSVTYNTTTYTGTLAASASTIQKIYLVATGTTDNYDRYITVGDSTYSWVNIGTTEITLTDYATKADLSQLEHEVNGIGYTYKNLVWSPGYVSGSTATVTSSQWNVFCQPVLLKAGETIYYKSSGIFSRAVVEVPNASPVAVGDTLNGAVLISYQTSDEVVAYTALNDTYIVISAPNGQYVIEFSSPSEGESLKDQARKIDAIFPYSIIYAHGIAVNTGDEYPVASRNCTGFIALNGATSITYTRHITPSASNNYGLAFYDESKTFLSAIAGGTNSENGVKGYDIAEAVVPSGAYYVRFTFWDGAIYGRFWYAVTGSDAIVNALTEKDGAGSDVAVGANHFYIHYSIRANVYMPYNGGCSVQIVNKNPSTGYQYVVFAYSVDASHQPVLVDIQGTYGKDSNTFDISGEYKYIIVMFKNGNNNTVNVSGLLSDYDINIVYDNPVLPLSLASNEKKWDFFSSFAQDDYNVILSDYLAIPKQFMTVRLDMPDWMRVRFHYGLREYAGWTGYYYNGDTVTFTRAQSAVAAEITFIDDRGFLVGAYERDTIGQQVSFTILDANDKDVFSRNFDAEKYLGAIRTTPNEASDLPVLVHTSDIHADALRFNSAFDYADYLGARLLINTGDNPFFQNSQGVLFHEKVVAAHKTDFANCIGNHDTYDSSLANIFGKCINPFASDYGYHKANGSDVTDKCYFFKDLTDINVRVIALDIYDGLTNAAYRARVSQTQMEWFIATLVSTPAGYGVVVIMHQAPHTVSAIMGKTDFNDATMDAQIYAIDSDYMTQGKITGNPFGKIIDAFIEGGTVSGSYTQKGTGGSSETVSYSADFSNLAEGVEFIAYLNGHTHRDFIGYVSDCEHNQLNLNVASAAPISQSTGYKGASDIFRDSVGANQDAFNVYTINRTDKTVGVARIGSNLSKDLRPRKVMFVRYADDE